MKKPEINSILKVRSKSSEERKVDRREARKERRKEGEGKDRAQKLTFFLSPPCRFLNMDQA